MRITFVKHNSKNSISIVVRPVRKANYLAELHSILYRLAYIHIIKI